MTHKIHKQYKLEKITTDLEAPEENVARLLKTCTEVIERGNGHKDEPATFDDIKTSTCLAIMILDILGWHAVYDVLSNEDPNTINIGTMWKLWAFRFPITWTNGRMRFIPNNPSAEVRFRTATKLSSFYREGCDNLRSMLARRWGVENPNGLLFAVPDYNNKTFTSCVTTNPNFPVRGPDGEMSTASIVSGKVALKQFGEKMVATRGKVARAGIANPMKEIDKIVSQVRRKKFPKPMSSLAPEDWIGLRPPDEDGEDNGLALPGDR